MNKKKKIAIIAGAVALVAIIAIILITYFTDSYNLYAAAYQKLFKNGSLECKFDAVMSIDGKDFNSTGDMKIKQNDKGQMMFIFIMTSNDTQLTQFTDGKFIYNDVNGAKTKVNIGEKASLQQDQGSGQKFNIDLYEQKLSSFLEAGKIKDLKLLDLVDSKYIKNIETKSTATGKQYNLTFADELTSSLVQVFADEQTSSDNATKVKMNVKGLQCAINENSSGLVSGANYVMSFDVTLPAKLTGEMKDKTLPVKVNIDTTFVNPGSPVDFTLPSTDGF